MGESVLFSFPAISVAPPHGEGTPGYLLLASSSQPTEFDPSRYDVYLRLQHTPDDVKGGQNHPTDCLIEAWRELRKTSPREFVLSTEFGDLTITFPELHHLIPQNDPRIDLPYEAKQGLQWESIVRTFESEVDRFVSYRKNEYSLINSPFDVKKGGAKAYEAGYAGYGEADIKPYNPSSYSSEKAASGGGGRVVLVDEENGREVGEVGGMQVAPINVVPGNKDPVEITFPQAGEAGPVTVRTVDYLKDAEDPAYANSSLVRSAATFSRLLITTSGYLSDAMTTGARNFTEKTRPNETPATFQSTTHERLAKVNTLTSTAAKFSSATVGKVSTLAQNAGARLAGKDKETTRGKPRNPGILNKSLIAFSTVADSIEYAGKALLSSGSNAATQVVQHKYGAEAGDVTRSLTGAVRNVGIVYIDASGVSRRAVVKGVAKGMVVGRVKGGGEVVVPADQSYGNSVNGYNPGPPPGYVPYADSGGNGGGEAALYFAPPPGRTPSPGPPGPYRPPMNRSHSDKGEFRF